jgi:cytochrome c oxidase subunit 1
MERAMNGNRLILANLWVSILAFGIAASMAVTQAISRANLDLPFRSPRMYYMSVTAHGVLMALVFTTFFIRALGYATARRETGTLRWPRFAWAMFYLGLAGTLSAVWAILTFKASVLYTFYPPLQAHPAFYIGLTLVVVASWGWCVNMIATWRESRKRNGTASLAMHGTAANCLLWLLATMGVAAEMLFQLIPWSLGLVPRVDPLRGPGPAPDRDW